MNPQEHICHNPRCWVYGRGGERHSVIHRQCAQRYRCKRCGRTFSYLDVRE
jgi:transposase-like protein